MYDLPERPSARDIIARSITCHPAMFREALIAQAEQHDDHARLTHNAAAARGAASQRNACLTVYDWIGRDDLTDADKALAIVTDGIGPMVIALNVAAKLQGLPPHIRTQAAVDYQEALDRAS